MVLLLILTNGLGITIDDLLLIVQWNIMSLCHYIFKSCKPDICKATLHTDVNTDLSTILKFTHTFLVGTIWSAVVSISNIVRWCALI